MIDHRHLKDQQDIADAFTNYFSSIVDKISKNNIDNKINDENLSTFHHYLEKKLRSSLLIFGFYNIFSQRSNIYN